MCTYIVFGFVSMFLYSGYCEWSVVDPSLLVGSHVLVEPTHTHRERESIVERLVYTHTLTLSLTHMHTIIIPLNGAHNV